MSGRGPEEAEGREAFEEEASGGSLAPSPELEEALREAAEAVGAREAPRPGVAQVPGDDDELEQLKERHLRLQADFENHRRRALREREEAFAYGHEKLAKDLLDTLDDLDRALEHSKSSEGGDLEAVTQGVELVRRELLAALGKHGVVEIEAVGQPFDPNLHEAMAQGEDAAAPPNTVLQVFQKGYRLRDRLLRPARVLVSKGRPAEKSPVGGS